MYLQEPDGGMMILASIAIKKMALWVRVLSQDLLEEDLVAQGHYLELVYHNQDEVFASDYNFSRYRFDYRYFQPFGKKMALASQLFGDFMQGNVPFFQMTGIGGPKRMRGYIDGRFRDHQLLLAQTEWRHFISRRW